MTRISYPSVSLSRCSAAVARVVTALDTVSALRPKAASTRRANTSPMDSICDAMERHSGCANGRVIRAIETPSRVFGTRFRLIFGVVTASIANFFCPSRRPPADAVAAPFARRRSGVARVTRERARRKKIRMNIVRVLHRAVHDAIICRESSGAFSRRARRVIDGRFDRVRDSKRAKNPRATRECAGQIHKCAMLKTVYVANHLLIFQRGVHLTTR
ncbi:hypothetical protein [Roseiterribacter gracilis]|uniref:hypothetical protein n=1 Tax=Roseiterribacter gracilis TaxID=2812848 RepID=UPI003B428B41